MMKWYQSRWWILFLVTVLSLPGGMGARAADSYTGWYLSAGANLLLMDGTGSWGGVDFDPTAASFDGGTGTQGLNWSEKLLLGGKPNLGYRFNERFAMQFGYSYLFPKRSAQYFTQQIGTATTQDRLDWEWRHSTLDLVGVYYPSDEWNVHFYAGAERVLAELDAVPSRSATLPDLFGGATSQTDSEFWTDTVRAWGAVVGAGLEMPSENLNVSTVVTLQYSTSRARQQLFVTPDFDLGVGGFALFAGLKWYFTAE